MQQNLWVIAIFCLITGNFLFAKSSDESLTKEEKKSVFPYIEAVDTHSPITLGVAIDQAHSDKGVKIAQIAAGSLAEKSGFKTGDVIVGLDGEDLGPNEISDAAVFIKILSMTSWGSHYRFRILRGGQPQVIEVSVPEPMNGPKRHFSELTTLGTYNVYLPPDYETEKKPYPLVVILHGKGSREGHGLMSALPRDKTIYLAVRAPYLEANGTGYTGWPPALNDDDPLELHKATYQHYVNWILKCIAECETLYRVDAKNIHLFGHSQGSIFALHTAFTVPQKIASVFAYAGMSDVVMPSPNELKAAHSVKFQISFGINDGWVEMKKSSKLLQEKLKEAEIQVVFKTHECGHEIGEAVLKDIQDWIFKMGEDRTDEKK